MLLGVVLFIWGIIGFKIFNTLSPEVPDNAVVENVSFKPLNEIKKDTFSIVADYRDPFLGTLPKKEQTKKPTSPKKEVPRRNITYTGSVINKNSKNSIFFVSIDGVQILMKPGQKSNEITLLKGTANSIRVSYSGITETIKLQR